MKYLDKLMEKKRAEGKSLDPMHMASKMSMLKALKDEMSGMMKDDLDGAKMKSVEVASPDSEGLKMGLDKAKDMLEGSSGEESESGEEESPEQEQSEHSYDDQVKMEMDKYQKDPSPENLASLMACLERKKAQME